jgi:hypothetical protein
MTLNVFLIWCTFVETLFHDRPEGRFLRNLQSLSVRVADNRDSLLCSLVCLTGVRDLVAVAIDLDEDVVLFVVPT